MKQFVGLFRCIPFCGVPKIGFLEKTLESMKALILTLVMAQEKGPARRGQRVKRGDGTEAIVLPSAGSYFMLVDAFLNYLDKSKDHPISDSVQVLAEQIRALIMPHELIRRKDQLAGKAPKPDCPCCRSEPGTREQNELAASLAADLLR